MKKSTILVLSAFVALSSLTIAAANSRSLDLPAKSPVAQNEFPDIFRPIGHLFKRIFGKKQTIIHEETAQIKNLSLSYIEVYLTCATSEKICSKAKSLIEVSVEAQNDENDVLSYNYEITGGEIVGKGEKVIWDLSGVKIGTYTIKASVDDGAGVIQTITKEIKVIECPNCN